jgi:hypothetical protein
MVPTREFAERHGLAMTTPMLMISRIRVRALGNRVSPPS